MMPQHIKDYLTARGQDPTAFKYGPAYGINWIAIPVPNKEGKPMFYKLRKDPTDTSDQPKYKFWPQGGDGASLFGLDVLPTYSDYVVVCEGELDCLLLRNQGINAVTSTAGAGTFKEDWVEHLSHIPNIYICFDKDKAGEQGANKLLLKLHLKHFNIFIVTLPDMPEGGKDISDWFLDNGGSKDEFFTLAEIVRTGTFHLPPLNLFEDVSLIRGEIARLAIAEDDYKKQKVHPVIHAHIMNEIGKQIKQAQRQLFRLKEISNTGIDIDKMKEKPILSILDIYSIPYTNISGDKVRFKLRSDDKTPSATGYLETNSYYDYGDSRGGSVIDLIMNLEQCNIYSALNILYEIHS